MGYMQVWCGAAALFARRSAPLQHCSSAQSFAMTSWRRVLPLLLLFKCIAAYDAPGIMQVQVEGFFNPDGRDSSGRCCVPPEDNATAVACGGSCHTFFRVCAAKVGPNWPEETDLRQHTLACPLGLLVTPTIANNSLEPRRDGLLLMRFPYREWPGKVKLVIEAWHDVTGELFGRDPYDHPEEKVAKLIVRVERRHKLVFGEDWLRRSVRVNLPNRSPQRKTNRRITFTYALRLAPLPDPTTTTTTTTTEPPTTTTTTTEAPLREATSTTSYTNKVVTSSSSLSFTPISSISVADHSVTLRPFTQYTPIDGMFLPQSSNAYPLPQSLFTPSTTTTTSTTSTTTEAPEQEFTLLENVFSPEDAPTTPTSPPPQPSTTEEERFTPVQTTLPPQPEEESEEDRFTPLGTIPRPTVRPLQRPPSQHKFPEVHFNKYGGLVLPPNFPLQPVAANDHAQQTPAHEDTEYTPLTGLLVAHLPGSLSTRPSAAPSTSQTTQSSTVHSTAHAPRPVANQTTAHAPHLTASAHVSHEDSAHVPHVSHVSIAHRPNSVAAQASHVTTSAQTPHATSAHASHSTSSHSSHLSSVHAAHGPNFASAHASHVTSSAHAPHVSAAHASLTTTPHMPSSAITPPPMTFSSLPEIEYTPLGGIHLVAVSTTERPEVDTPIHSVFASFHDRLVTRPTGFAQPQQDDFLPYSYPTTLSAEDGDEEATTNEVVASVNSAIVEKNANGTEASVFSTMPVVVVENSPVRRNATASVMLDGEDGDESDESAEHDDENEEEALEELYEYAVYPNAGDF